MSAFRQAGSDRCDGQRVARAACRWHVALLDIAARGSTRRAGVDLGRCRDDRPYRAPTAAAVGARSARLGNLLGGTRPAGDDVGDDVPGGAGAQTHEHQRVYPSCSATPVAVRIIPGETGADMCRNLSECVRIYGYETEYPDHLVTVL